jgi:YVTN family beta-propeller protein
MQDRRQASSFTRDGARRCIALVGLAVMIGGCTDPGLAPAAPQASADVVQTLTPTHPAGVLSGTTPLGGEPYGVDVSTQGLVYATQLDFNQVATSTLASQTINSEISVGSIPTGVTFAQNGQTAYVTNQFSANVGVIDVKSGTQVATIPTPDGSSPFVVAVSANGKQLFIGTNGASVLVVDAKTLAITDQIPVPSVSNGFALSPDNKTMFVSSFISGTVTEFVVKTHAVVQTFTPGGAPQGMVTNKHGTELYVVNEAGYVSLFDIASGALISTLSLNAGGFGAAVTPDDNNLYLTEPNAGLVQIVDLKARALKTTISVGGNPRRIAFSSKGDVGVVTNLDGYLSFIK